LYVNLENRIRRDVAMSGSDASLVRFVAAGRTTRGIQ
jgi:hypothetical protein